ncbi:hypothetical protein HY624_00410 [Candidatus Uhrbacteria bacterium]|nr:hypothetical protein [Candidatus Uhrbacteria bacterium]
MQGNGGPVRVIVALESDAIAVKTLEFLRTENSTQKPRQFGEWQERGEYRVVEGLIGVEQVTLLVVPTFTGVKEDLVQRVPLSRVLVVVSRDAGEVLGRNFVVRHVNQFNPNAAPLLKDSVLAGFPWVVFCGSDERLKSVANQIAADYVWHAAARMSAGLAPWGQRKDETRVKSGSRSGRWKKWQESKRTARAEAAS